MQRNITHQYKPELLIHTKHDESKCILLNERNQAQRETTHECMFCGIREKGKLIATENDQWLALGLGDNQGMNEGILGRG